VLHTRCFLLLGVLLIGGYGPAGMAGAQPPDRRESLSDVVLPCGVRAALGAIGDRSTPDRGQFILEITRRLHQMPAGPRIEPTDTLPTLIAHLDRCGAAGGAAGGAAAERATGEPGGETLPLPLSASMWVDTVFGGRVNPARLAAAILESRNASLLYVGLLSLDEATRDWIAGQPELVGELATQHAAAFTLVAPGLRVTNDGVQVPGGQEAEPVWEALVGRSTKRPVEFVRALMVADERHLPYMFGTLAQLSPAEAHLALHLDAPDPAERIDSARRLHAIYIRLAQKWRVESRAFWRPTYDPALLAAALRHDDEGRPLLPGTRRFWTEAFGGGQLPDDPREVTDSDPLDLAWLCERIFEGDASRHRRRYHQVLFASRVVRNLTADQAHAAVEAVRAADRYPALVAALERAGVTDLTVIAAAARRAAQLSDIGNANAAVRASAQFQSLLALLQRATVRNSISTSTFADLVTTLVAVDLEDGEAYRGRLVRWLDQRLQPHAATPAPDGDKDTDFEEQSLERALLDLVSGASLTTPTPMPLSQERGLPSSGRASDQLPPSRMLSEPGAIGSVASRTPTIAATPAAARAAPRIVEWEGTRYRVDLAAAEAARMDRLRGEQPRPYVSAARALIGVADALRDLAGASASPRGGTARLNGGSAASKDQSRASQGVAADGPGADRSRREALTRAARLFGRVEHAVGWDAQDWSDDQQQWLGADTRDRARDVSAALQRAEQRGDRAGAARLAPAILLLADALLSRGLTELVYATALGRPERAGFSAEEAAAHHDFGTHINGVRNARGPWEHPVLSSATGGRESRVMGSLIGLDVALASLSLVRLSSRLPPGKPTLNESDRHALIESVALVRELDDEDRDRIVDAIRKGRDKMAAVTTSDRARAIADEIEMDGTRRALLIWTATRTPDRVATFLSPSELLWLGLGPTRIDDRLHAWGAPAKPRLGCLCLELPDRRSLAPFTGRWGSGIFVTAFPDLNLRLAELLAELRMPAALLGPILTSATLELVNNTVSRDADDRRALVEFVSALTLDRLEQYLALLTTDGPLVPIGKASETSTSAGVP
jgi:hypothetical protein